MFKKLFAALLILTAAACGQDSGTVGDILPGNLPDSNGGRLDVLVVAKESVWEDVAGEIFRKYFTAAQDGLPQAEPIFTVRQIEPKSFNTLLQRARNIVTLQLGPKSFQIDHNKFAKPQVVISYSAPTEEDLAKLILSNQKEVVQTLHDSEMEYIQKKIPAHPQPLPKALKEHHLSMRIPASFELDVNNENVAVLWNKTLKTDQGIIIHFEPLNEGENALGENIIPLRDSLTKKYIPGDREGSYMAVEDLIPPVFRNLKIDGNFTIETRGLWRTVGDMMGGAFISYTIYDDTHNQRITLDAFVYAPELKKRNFILELEAILRTVHITD